MAKVLAKISTNSESINEENKEIIDVELVRDHKSNSEKELDNESDIYEFEKRLELKNSVAKGKIALINKWCKKELRKIMRTLTHNIVIKFPENFGEAKVVSSAQNSWKCLLMRTEKH
ncbi:hypothetical protein AVEN_186254-1 [Araneus ventricosus]|uniref:Uncharacterized protein n=1 Tax=Araneus ventricosus TaxID=182803 RepID=A0A4Y2UVG8_ARAVE|nr:hypothetical protein AVEN_186254-1 [Araneus ventricosus]